MNYCSFCFVYTTITVKSEIVFISNDKHIPKLTLNLEKYFLLIIISDKENDMIVEVYMYFMMKCKSFKNNS